MTAALIDGHGIAAGLRADLKQRIAALGGQRKPGLAVVLVGDDPASHVYVRNKLKACAETGIQSLEHRLPAEASEIEVLLLIAKLNADPAVDGILVQLPLPPQIDTERVVQAVDPDKDVDGFHPLNIGRLVAGLPGFVACTPRGSLMLIKTVRQDLSGLKAVVIGRSLTVGKPMALLLNAADCTVTLAHSRTTNIADECQQADIVVAAVGRPLMVKGDWIKPGAIVIDVGINRTEDGKLVGDVDFAAAAEHAAAITPVPKGVGPMTIACLLENTWDSYLRRLG
jgi:methylenetetrahydrofolate dehydrogenase (NADP+)/methenyltetrahydrofolate cyclohydrolase